MYLQPKITLHLQRPASVTVLASATTAPYAGKQVCLDTSLQFMTRLSLAFSLLLAIALIAAASAGEIVYKPAPQDINELAKTVVDRLFRSGDEPELGDLASYVSCGPGLWRTIKVAPNIEALDPASATSMVDLGGGNFQPFEGALFHSDAERSELVRTVRVVLGGSDFIVRPPNDVEKKVYWALIPYDIEEPIFVLDNGERRVLVDFVLTEDGPQLLWVGDMSQFGFGESGE